MLNRIKKAWRLSKYPDAVVIDASKLNAEQAKILSAEPGAVVEILKDPIGDGDAAFFGEPTPEEQLEYERDQEGTLPWYKRLANLGKEDNG